MLNFSDFSDRVMKDIKDYLPYGGDGYCVETNQTRKVNEGMVTMVTVRRDGSEIGASIPMERIYHEYERSGNDFSVFFPSFASQFCAQAAHVPEDILAQAAVVRSMDWEQLRDKVYVHAIGATRNEELLKTVPHKQIGDVCSVYRIHITETERDCATVLITNDMAERLHVSTEEIHQAAVRNSMEKYPPVCLRMSDMMEELIGSSPEIDGEEIDTPLYVLTNRTKMDGASVIFYPDVADTILRNMPENYYLLPSSVHEWLVVSKNRADKEELEEMVHAVNETTGDPKDQLSDMVHEYDPVRRIVYAGTVPDPPQKEMGLEERERSL